MNGRRIRPLTVILFALLVGPAIAGIPAAPSAGTEGTLVILFTHDLHSRVQPLPRLTDSGETVERGGFARIATLIREARAQDGARLLVLDAGDFSMGTLFHMLYTTEAAELRLLGMMGYDATTLGNHEFDFRVGGLVRSLAAAKSRSDKLPAVLASNIAFEGTTETAEAGRTAFRDFPVRDYLVLERNGLRVGLFGLFGLGSTDDSPFADPAVFLDPAEQARRVVETLRTKEKVDFVIALSHGGTSSIPKRSEDERLARAVPGIDVIISGHTHSTLERPLVVGKTIIVSAGANGEKVGRLEVDKAEGGEARVIAYALRTVGPDIADDPAVAAQAAEFAKMIDRDLAAVFPGGSAQVLAESAFDMEPLAAMEAHPGEAGLGDLITDAYRAAVRKAEGTAYEHVHFAVQPVGVIRDSFLRGLISVEEAFRVLSLGLGEDGHFGYPLLAAYMTGKEVRRLLEVEASVAPTNVDARLQFAGLRFAYNPHRLIFDRVTRVEVEDEDGNYRPLDSKKLYRIVINSYTEGMVGYVSKASKGILKMRARDKNGQPLSRPLDAVVDADPVAPGVQEIKEWVALSDYFRSFPDLNGNGVPDMPDRYRRPQGRFAAEPSWNPAALLFGGNGITLGILAVLIVVAVLIILLVRRLRRRSKARRAMRQG